MVSVIIPTYNEEKALSDNSVQFHRLCRYSELIFVGGGSSDRTSEIASHYGRIIRSKKGRPTQLNCGARAARADILKLYKAFLKDTLELANKIQCEIKIVAYEADNREPRYFRKIAGIFKLYRQKGRNLGERLHICQIF